MTDTKQIDLLDSDGENLAVRAFLLRYGSAASPSIEGMRDHMKLSGFDGCWPDWAATQSGYLSKSGAQDWIRHLFSLEADRNKRAPVGSLTDDDLLRIADDQVLGVFDDATGAFRVYLQPGTDIAHVVIAFARALLSSVAPRVPEGFVLMPKYPTGEIISAMASSTANDGEGEFLPLADLIGFSGDNKTRVVLQAAYSAAIAAPQPTQEG